MTNEEANIALDVYAHYWYLPIKNIYVDLTEKKIDVYVQPKTLHQQITVNLSYASRPSIQK